jgi:membrane-associated PAP2 superfamily phosphatase
MTRRTLSPLTPAFWGRHLAVPFLVFLSVAVICELSDLDLFLADRFYDFQEGIWPARESFWASWLIHQRGRDFVLVLAIISCLAWLGSYANLKLRCWRRQALYLLLVIVLGTGLVTLGKRLSNRHCPWSMERYGGTVPYTQLFHGTPSGFPPGKCFPAGHASGGYALMGLYFIFRDRRPATARALLAASFALGTIFAVGQMARGAHFFSHNVWTAAICWFVALALYLPLLRRQGINAERGASAPLPITESCPVTDAYRSSGGSTGRDRSRL